MRRRSEFALGVWFAAVVVLGGVLTSYHQPFRAPEGNVLELAGAPAGSGWRAIHVLSPGCGCSLRVMRHLLSRPPLEGTIEQIVLIEEEGTSLSGSKELLGQLDAKGFKVTRWLAKDIPQTIGLRGVPLFILATPESRVVYSGGYGIHEDEDVRVFKQIRAGNAAVRLPVLGCAIGARLQRSADPFHLKY